MLVVPGSGAGSGWETCVAGVTIIRSRDRDRPFSPEALVLISRLQCSALPDYLVTSPQLLLLDRGKVQICSTHNLLHWMRDALKLHCYFLNESQYSISKDVAIVELMAFKKSKSLEILKIMAFTWLIKGDLPFPLN